MRAPQARRHGPGHGVQRRSGRPGAELRGPRLRIPPHRRFERRICRQAGQRAGRRSHTRGREDAGAAGRRHPRPGHHRGVARKGHPPRHPGHRCRPQSGARARGLQGFSRPRGGRHRRERRQGCRRRLGRGQRAFGHRAGAALRGRRRGGHHLHRHRSRRHPEGPQPARHGGPRPRHGHSRDRLGRSRRHRRRGGPVAARVPDARRGDHGAGALRWAARCQGCPCSDQTFARRPAPDTAPAAVPSVGRISRQGSLRVRDAAQARYMEELRCRQLPYRAVRRCWALPLLPERPRSADCRSSRSLAKAPFATTQAPYYYRFAHGKMQATVVSDGILPLGDPSGRSWARRRKKSARC